MLHADAVNRLSLLASERLIPTRAVRLLTPLLAVASLVLGFVMSVALSLEQRVITVLASISYVASIQVGRTPHFSLTSFAPPSMQ